MRYLLFILLGLLSLCGEAARCVGATPLSAPKVARSNAATIETQFLLNDGIAVAIAAYFRSNGIPYRFDVGVAISHNKVLGCNEMCVAHI
jgi:hypothetical protein